MNTFSRLSTSPLFFFFCCFWITLGFTGNGIAQSGDQNQKKDPVSISIHPLAHTILYNRVSLLPFKADNQNIADQVTRAFYSALLKSKKYALIPLDHSTTWFYEHVPTKTAPEKDTLSVKAGIALKSRGVISGEVITQDPSSDARTKNRLMSLTIRMVDVKTGNEVWQIQTTITTSPQKSLADLPFIQQVVYLSVERLIAKMVEVGDSFAARLPQPRIFSYQGNKGNVTLIIRPDPVLLFSEYRLLRADNPDDIFTTVASIRNIPYAELIIQDRDLNDQTTYYYTIVGVASTGLTSIPGPPLAITTLDTSRSKDQGQ